MQVSTYIQKTIYSTLNRVISRCNQVNYKNHCFCPGGDVDIIALNINMVFAIMCILMLRL